jgi:hypothetical protein
MRNQAATENAEISGEKTPAALCWHWPSGQHLRWHLVTKIYRRAFVGNSQGLLLFNTKGDSSDMCWVGAERSVNRSGFAGEVAFDPK